MNLLAESFINECSELLCCDHSWGQTIQMGNSPWGEKNTSGHHYNGTSHFPCGVCDAGVMPT